MNTFKAALYALIVGGLVASGLIAVSWDRARARGESWELGWHGLVFGLAVLVVFFVIYSIIQYIRAGDQGEAPIWAVFILGIAAGVALTLTMPNIEWRQSVLTVLALLGVVLYFLALEFCYQNSLPDEPNPNPGP